jgi:outer membrane protein TolC
MLFTDRFRAAWPVRSKAIFRKALHTAIIGCAMLSSSTIRAQAQSPATGAEEMSLDACIAYALKNQPALNQSLVNIAIARATNKISLAGWLPQVGLSANTLHYFALPTAFVANPKGGYTETHSGVTNSVIPNLGISQNIFTPQLLYAKKAAPLLVKQAELAVDSSKIGIVSGVSKAFYALLLTLEQINILKEDTARLNRNVTDTRNHYEGGIVDESDYDEAIISLNNSAAQLRQQIENLAPTYALLKQIMGWPQEKNFNVVFDTAKMTAEIGFDTTRALSYEKRIEYTQLQTAKILQQKLTEYYKLSFLPSLSAQYSYNLAYESDVNNQVFSNSYPYAYIGLSLNIPLFTGFARVENVKKSKLQERDLELAEKGLQSEIFTQYASALAGYKSALYNFKMMKDNEEKARRVYRIVSLQYRQGIVAYLNMITAESNLITAEIGRVNALFQLLSDKIDLETALGDIAPAK